MEEYDYIVIGAGSGGCTAAGRLGENQQVRVCLLEAGGKADNILVRIPAGIAFLIPSPICNWRFRSVPQPGLNGRISYHPRGRGLGGSSAINAMVYLRGLPEDFDSWSDFGIDDWGWRDVFPFFLRSEDNSRGKSRWHGAGGPLSVTDQVSLHPASARFLEAAREIGLPVTTDLNGAQREGAGYFQVTQKAGERVSAARAFLDPGRVGRSVNVITGATAERIVMQGTRATAVRYRKAGKLHTVKATRGIVLAAGVFQTPHLLMLSGLGPANHLKANGIEVIADLPGVGENLHDHIDYVAIWKTLDPSFLGVSGAGMRVIASAAGEWISKRTGLLTSPLAEAGAIVRSSSDLLAPDIQLHFVIGIVDNHARKFHLGHGYSCHVSVLNPKSRGNVRLAGGNPASPPVIDPRYLEADDDLETLLAGFKLARTLFRAKAFAQFNGRELYTGGICDDSELKAIIRGRADTIYHPVGTCRMGNDAQGVVDQRLKVKGIDGLRIADASVMPRIPRANTNAATIMIGERCAEFLRSEERK